MDRCYVIFPGGFKPVHSGHIALMEKYLESTEYDVRLIILISKMPREGITAESSKWFLEQVFKNEHRVKVMIAPDASPIKTAYDMAGTAEFGTGYYALGASAKGTDIKRAEDFAEKFSEGGKFYEPESGVKGLFFPIDPAPINFSGRDDIFDGAPISSTIVRNDLRSNDYEMFGTAYLPLVVKNMVDDKIVHEYFERLQKEVLPVLNSSLQEDAKVLYRNILNEGGAAGHMSHPYDVDSFTFRDLKNLINDFFAGKITDITEKLDGQNLFASVDEHGNTIFARNEKTLYEQPWYLDDIRFNPKWIGTPTVQHAFTNGAETIDKVFHNIPNATNFFNYDDKADGVRYRYWLNLEIIDTQNFNVIPYADSKVSFHHFVVTCFDYSEKDKFSKSEDEARSKDWDKFEMDDQENAKKMETVQKAIDKTSKTAFKAQITPEVIFKKVQQGEVKTAKYENYIDNIISKFGLSDNNTIREYKVAALTSFFNKSKTFNWLTGDAMNLIINRWIDGTSAASLAQIKNAPLEDGSFMTKEQFILFRDYDKEESKNVMKNVIKPLDTLFIKVGNEAIKCIEGLANAGHEKDIIRKLRTELADIKDGVSNSDDEKKKRKLQAALARLSEVDNELSAAEGIVFRYKGRVLKFTGSFAPLNQIFGMRAYDR